MSEHAKLFIRRSEARERLGVSEEVFTKLLLCKRLAAVKLTPNGRAFYRSADVEALATKAPTPVPSKEGNRSNPNNQPKKNK